MRRELLPSLRGRAAQLKRVCASVDKYQQLVDEIKKSVGEMEDRVAASAEATASISITKIFSVFSVRAPIDYRCFIDELTRKHRTAEKVWRTRSSLEQECNHRQHIRMA